MKKSVILLGLVAMATSLAFAQSDYELLTDGSYKYVGTPVEQLTVDFTTWSTDALPSPLYDAMPLAEKDGMGFVKWKIASRNCGSKGTVNALFNNDYADFSDGGASVRNNATTNKPRIYLPTTTRGVKKITVFAGNSNVSLGVRYKDDNNTTWKWAGSLVLDASFAETSLELNTVGKTSIYIEHGNTPYVAITNLELELEEAIEPEPSLYVLDPESGKYEYQGEPVDSLNVDFTTWLPSYLPSTLSDDMPLAEKEGMGFVKWKIQKRACGDKGQVNALFNNDNSDFSEGGAEVKNNATANKPRIYLPTTSTGVESIKVFAGNGGNVALGVFYKDADHANWTWKASLPIEADYAEQTVAVNSNGPTTIYLEYSATKWIALTNLELELKKGTTTGIEQITNDPYGASRSEELPMTDKALRDGQLIIIRNGVRYNACGTKF